MFNNLRNEARVNKYIKINSLPYLIAYMVNKNDNTFTKYYIKNTPDSIASFVCLDMFSDKLITDKYDNVVMTTMGCFIDIMCDTNYLEEYLKPVLIEYQTFEKEPKLQLATFSLERLFNV